MQNHEEKDIETDSFKNISIVLKERFGSPIIISYFISSAAYNWKIIFLIFYIKDYNFDQLIKEILNISNGWAALLIPLMVTGVFLLLYPMVSFFLYCFWEYFNCRKKDIKLILSNGVYLSSEEAVKIRLENSKLRNLLVKEKSVYLENESLYRSKIQKYEKTLEELNRKLEKYNMKSDDALSEADIYLAYGKKKEAISLLASALLSNPERMDLLNALKEI